MKEKKISEELKYCLEGNCGSCSSYSIGAVVTCPKLLEKAHETIREYESIGLLPEQIREIDKLYTEKCEEVAKLQKELKRYRDLEEQCIFENAVGIEVMLKKFGEFMSDMHELCEYKELEREGKLIKLIWAAGMHISRLRQLSKGTNKSAKGVDTIMKETKHSGMTAVVFLKKKSGHPAQKS